MFPSVYDAPTCFATQLSSWPIDRNQAEDLYYTQCMFIKFRDKKTDA